jgi:competence protein ComEA
VTPGTQAPARPARHADAGELDSGVVDASKSIVRRVTLRKACAGSALNRCDPRVRRHATGRSLGGVTDLDRPRLALYVALGLIVCFFGARYLRSQAPVAGGAPAAAPEAPVTGEGTAASTSPAPVARPPSTVRIERADGGLVTVHVAGAVRRPGLYRLPAGARVDDALRRAGGPARRADLNAVNLAAKLEDGRQILVPRRAAGPPAGGGGGGAAAAGGGQGGAGAPVVPINLNTATLEQLDTLDGVGPGIARRILDYREQHGGFRRVEELAEVPGIGAKRLATLTPLVTV